MHVALKVLHMEWQTSSKIKELFSFLVMKKKFMWGIFQLSAHLKEN